MADKSVLQSLQEGSSVDVASVIYEKVNSLLGAGNQLFAMEFPARPLNGKDYEYDTSDCYSTLTKPYTVQEKEFLLSDQLFDVAPIVQGPNGEKLSTVYTTVLNNYVPKLDALKSFVHDQKNLRNWLLTHVEDEVDGKKRELSRMAIAKELYNQFLERRNAWYEKKNKTYDEYKKNDDLDGYARWLSSEGLVQEEQINNFYNDAVVRGNYHEVLTLLGFLNVSSPSEVLESTKQKMRSSLRRSLDGSSDVYPVQFQPGDWFKALRPNMSPKDLTMATDSLVAEYRAKQARLRGLQEQLAEQNIIEIPVEEQERLNSEVESCERRLSDSEQKLITQYGEGAVSAVKAVISVYKSTSDPVLKAQEAIALIKETADTGTLPPTENRIYGLIEGIAADVVDGVAKSCQAQQAILKDMKKLNDARMAYADAKVKDMRLEKLRIEEQINAVKSDLDFLTPLVTGTIAQASDPEIAKQDADLMPAASDDAEDSNFMDVIIKSDESGSFSSGSSSSSSSQSSMDLGGWFWSGSTSQSQSSAESQQEKLSMQKKLEIGFRVKKVTFDRGGWFNANVLKLSSNYARLADIRFSSGLDKDQVHSATNAARMKNLVQYDALVDGQNKKLSYVLPAFPTGFVIAKDITIRIQSSKEESQSSQKYVESNQSSGGGLFCFRGNAGSSSQSKSESAYFGSSENFFYIRIPGPQILGWFLQFTPPDNALPYTELDPELYSDTLQSLMAPDAIDASGDREQL